MNLSLSSRLIWGLCIPEMLICLSCIAFNIISVWLGIIIALAFFGKTGGLREFYVKVLLKIFEFGSKNEKSIYHSEKPDEGDSAQSSTSERPRSHSEGAGIIAHDKTETIAHKLAKLDDQDGKQKTVKLLVNDLFDFTTAGMESIIDDKVTGRFKAEELPSWNLLTRTSYGFHHLNWKLTFLWIVGFFFRYFIMLPIRATLFFVAFLLLYVITHASGYISNVRVKKWLNERAMLTCMRIFCRTVSAIVTVHNRENRAKHGGICVANHTSPIDVMILSCDNCYAMVGQRQGGVLGLLQRTLSRSGDHIWFERTEAKDRAKVAQKLKEHVDEAKSPIIIFPEGTCINNTSVMMFKKGSFEVCEVVYPIAMKYDPRFGDAFWNSSEQSYGEYLFRMMTSWAIICDVWYLPPMRRQENESSIHFAARVKKAIAEKGGLVDLEWDGGLKRAKVSPRMIAEHQKLYWEWLSRKTSLGITPSPRNQNSHSNQQEKEEDSDALNSNSAEQFTKDDSEKYSVLTAVPEENKEEIREAELASLGIPEHDNVRTAVLRKRPVNSEKGQESEVAERT